MLDEEHPSQSSDVDYLLSEFENILESDPFIDELGFVHSSQFAALCDEKDVLNIDRVDLTAHVVGDAFWHKDHKLAVSTSALSPLYKSATNAYTSVCNQYKKVVDGSKDDFEKFLETKVMKHSKALLLLNYDNSSAWNVRKLVMSKNDCLSDLMDELKLSTLILSFAPKSEQTWCQRRWVIKMIASRCQILPDVVASESELVQKIAEKFKMNYRAWNHRCWLVSYMTDIQISDELTRSRKWSEMHATDSCGFHFRRRLMLKMCEKHFKLDTKLCCQCNFDLLQLWMEELSWTEMLIKRNIGREAVWVHRRFLFQFMIENIMHDHCACCCHAENNLSIFLDVELQFFHSCLKLLSSDFEDGQLHRELAASYVLWIPGQLHGAQKVEFQKKLLNIGELKNIISKLCPGKQLLWEALAT